MALRWKISSDLEDTWSRLRGRWSTPISGSHVNQADLRASAIINVLASQIDRVVKKAFDALAFTSQEQFTILSKLESVCNPTTATPPDSLLLNISQPTQNESLLFFCTIFNFLF